MTSGSIFFYQNWLNFLLALWLRFLLTKALIVKNDHIFWKIGFFENLITDEEICLSYNIKVKILSNVLNSFENISIDERGKRILKLQIYSKMSDAGSLKKESLPVIKQLKDGYIKHKKEWIEGVFNGYQRCSKSN